MYRTIIPIAMLFISAQTFPQSNSWELLGHDPNVVAISLCASPSGELFGGNFDGIYHSTDRGMTWLFLNPPDPLGNQTVLSIDRTGILYASGLGILRSTDNGLTWEQSFSPDTNSGRVYESPRGTLFSATWNNGIRQSLDHGVSWHVLPTPSTYTLAFFVNQPGDMFQSSDYEIQRTTNEGISWESVRSSTADRAAYCLMVTRSGAMFGGTPRGVITSSDSGTTWEEISGTALDQDYVSNIIEGPTGILLARSGFGTIFISQDTGKSWNPVVIDDAVTHVDPLIVDSLGRIYAGTDVGVYFSDDGGISWKGTGSGFLHRSILSFAITPNGVIYSGTDAGLFHSTDNGDSWKKDNIAQGNNFGFGVTSVLANQKGTIFARSIGLGLVVSEDSGRSWSVTPLVDSLTWAVQLDTSGNPIAGLASGVVLHSTDNGNSWTQLGVFPGPYSILSLQVDRNNRMFAGTGSGGVYESTDGGATWEYRGLASKDIPSLLITSEQIVFAGTYNEGLFRSTDGGTIWEPLSSPFSQGSVYSLIAAPHGTIYAGTSFGLFFSSDNGESWQVDTTGLGNVNVRAIIVTPEGNIIAGTGGGAYRSSITLAVNPDRSVRQHFALSQNYPNPFNSVTTIEYSIAAGNMLRSAVIPVRLTVFDILGREAETLVNEAKRPGSYSVRFNASTLPSGVYFCRLQTGPELAVRKMVLLR